MTSRREGRELALQALYSADIEAMDGTTALRKIMENFGFELVNWVV